MDGGKSAADQGRSQYSRLGAQPAAQKRIHHPQAPTRDIPDGNGRGTHRYGIYDKREGSLEKQPFHFVEEIVNCLR